MKLSDFLGGIWKDLETPFIGAINSVKTAFASKDVGQVINSVSGLVKVGAVAIESAATSAQAAGATISGPDKKIAVQTAVTSVVAPEINNLTIPGIDSSVIQGFFGQLLNSVIEHLIDAGVSELNAKGWRL